MSKAKPRKPGAAWTRAFHRAAVLNAAIKKFQSGRTPRSLRELHFRVGTLTVASHDLMTELGRLMKRDFQKAARK